MLVSAFGSRNLRQTVPPKPLPPITGARRWLPSASAESARAWAWRRPLAVSLSHEPQPETLIVAKPSRTRALAVM
jgi:hypothetical protein